MYGIVIGMQTEKGITLVQKNMIEGPQIFIMGQICVGQCPTQT